METIFRSWVPNPWKLSVLLAIAIFFSSCSGIPSTIYTYVVGSQSANSPDLSMAMYAYCAGMACAISLIFRLTIFIPKKRLLLCCVVILIVVNFVLAINQSPLVNIMLMFIIGCIKIIISMAMVSELMPFLMPTGERYQMYVIYYPMSLVFPIVAGLITAYLSNNYFWEMGYYLQNILLGLSLLLIIVFLKTQQIRSVPLYQYDWLSSILLAAALLCFSFVASYGLQNNWLHSKSIILSIVLFVVFSVLFFNRNYRKKRPVIKLSALGNKGTILTLLTIFILGLFYSNTTLLTNLMTAILPANPTKQAEINAYVAIGYILGSVVVYLYFKKTKKCKPILLISAIFYLLSNMMLYSLINPQTDLNYLILPIIFRGMAIIISFIATAVYLAANVAPKALTQSIVWFILIRTFFVTVFWATVISNCYNKLQNIHQTRLAELLTQQALADRNMIANVQKQANLLGLHDLYLYLCLANIVVIIIIALLPYHSSTVRRVFNWKNKKDSKEYIQLTAMS